MLIVVCHSAIDSLSVISLHYKMAGRTLISQEF